MTTPLFNETNMNLNISQKENHTPSKAFKINQKNNNPKDTSNNDIQPIVEDKSDNPKFEKLKHQVLEDLKANGGDSREIKRSFSRGYTHRIWTQALSVLGGFMAGDSLASNLIHAGFPFETAYQSINRTADKRNGSILPELAKSYEAEDGKNKDHAGSIGHVAAKTVDHIGRGLVEPLSAATISRGVSSLAHKVKGTGEPTFTGQWKKELTTGGDFGNGELIDELSYYGGLDAGIHTANALGLKKTWSGAVLASAIAAGCYTTRDPNAAIMDKQNPGALSRKFVARILQRLGVMGQIYALPLPFMDSAFPASKKEIASEESLATQTEAEKSQTKKVNFAARTSEILYGLITFSALSGLYAYQNKKA